MSRPLRRALGMMIVVAVLVMSFPAAAAEKSFHDELEEFLSAVDEMTADQLKQLLASLSPTGNWEDIESVAMAIQLLQARRMEARLQRLGEEIQSLNQEIAWRRDMLSKLQGLQRLLIQAPGRKITVDELPDSFGFTDQQLQELMKRSSRAELLAEQIDELIKLIRAELTQIGNNQDVLAVRFDILLNNYADASNIMRSHMQRLEDAISSIRNSMR